uniref:Uncharacterized protein n=1 Tax=Meleagris gallopavo TaxID=9103 RepID=A0A803XQ29_MELGA
MHFKHTFRDGDSTTSPTSLFQCLSSSSVKYFLISNLNLSCCNLRPFPLVPQQFYAGIPLYEAYYKQVDPTYMGRVGASKAALFFKKSGLLILSLEKYGIWLIQKNSHEVNLSSLNFTMPPPKFHDTSSLLKQ